MCHLTGALGWFPTLLSSATALHNVDMFIVNKERCLHDLCALAIFWMWQTKESDVRERSVYTAQISSLQADNGLKRWCLSYLWACTDQSHCSGWIQWPWRHARSYFPTFKSSSGLTPKLSPLALWTVYLTGQWVSEHDAHMQRARPPVTNLLKSDQKTEEKKAKPHSRENPSQHWGKQLLHTSENSQWKLNQVPSKPPKSSQKTIAPLTGQGRPQTKEHEAKEKC